MDEEITIINSNTRNEKIMNYFINNKKNLIIGFSIILIVIFGSLSVKKMSELSVNKTPIEPQLIGRHDDKTNPVEPKEW